MTYEKSRIDFNTFNTFNNVDTLEEKIDELKNGDVTKATERKIEKLREEQEEVQEAMDEVQNAADFLSEFTE